MNNRYEEVTNAIIKKIAESKIIPVLKLNDVDEALHIVDALSAGGISVAEITYRTQMAGECIKAVSEKRPDILVGAGTVTSIKTAKDAIKNGARFIVMPGFDSKVTAYCIKKNIPVIPGVATPSEVMSAVKQGLKLLKLFPAEVLGGVKMLNALKGPFGDISFVPTGGITKENAKSYLELSNVTAVGGTWIVKNDFVSNKEWNKITEEACSTLQIIL